MKIVKVQVESDSKESILKVIPKNYRIRIAPGVGFGIYDVNKRMVGSCQITAGKTLSVYAYTPTESIKRAFIAAFEKHNSTDEVECLFIEEK